MYHTNSLLPSPCQYPKSSFNIPVFYILYKTTRSLSQTPFDARSSCSHENWKVTLTSNFFFLFFYIMYMAVPDIASEMHYFSFTCLTFFSKQNSNFFPFPNWINILSNVLNRLYFHFLDVLKLKYTLKVIHQLRNNFRILKKFFIYYIKPLCFWNTILKLITRWTTHPQKFQIHLLPSLKKRKRI